MFDKSAIQQVTQSEATSASNLALQHSLTSGEPLAIFHDDFKTVDLEQYLHQQAWRAQMRDFPQRGDIQTGVMGKFGRAWS